MVRKSKLLTNGEISELIIDSLYDKDLINADIYKKCSNNTIRNRLSKLTQEEKNERLEGKINPFEIGDYKFRISELDYEYKRLKRYIGENKSDDSIERVQKKIDFLEKKIFDYEKRIYRGYDFNKKLDKVPKYNINDFLNDDVINESMNDVLVGNVTFGRLEQLQLDKQKNIEFDETEEDKLFEYFHFDDVPLELNSVLDHNYGERGEFEKSIWDYWSHELYFDDIMSDIMSNKYKYPIQKIDSAMKKTEGLLQPTVLYTGVGHSNIVNIHTRVGDKVNMKSFISASFQEGIAQRYGKELEGDNLPKLYVKFLAPAKTKGICANDGRINDMEYFFEHEYLLDRGQNGTVVDIDYNTGCVTVLLE